jgi:hypothetical protein
LAGEEAWKNRAAHAAFVAGCAEDATTSCHSKFMEKSNLAFQNRSQTKPKIETAIRKRFLEFQQVA